MEKKQKSYTEEFRRQMVRVARSGRTPEDLGREFELSAQAMRSGTGSDRPSSTRAVAQTV